MLKKCKSCKSRFTFMDDNKRFTGIGCLEYGVIVSLKRLNDNDPVMDLRERTLEHLPCLDKIDMEQFIQNFEHISVQNVVDKEAALRAVKEAYKQGFNDGQK